MIQIAADLADGQFVLTIEGHENWVAAGNVCAAVSAIAQTALLGLEEIARQNPDIVSIDIKEK